MSSLEEEATIFSRSNAPPPPFISCKSESISSAPSIVRSRLCTLFKEISGMFSCFAKASVSFDVGTA